MKKMICLILTLVLCLSFACTAFAAGTDDDGFVGSPGEIIIPSDCEHGNTTVIDKKDPTCTEDGYTGDVICEDCGEVIEEGTVIPRNGHNFVDGVCTVCGVLSGNPQTGDTSGIGLWVGLMVLSAACLVAVVVVYRKKAVNQ